jgi:hypothetical protein
MVQRSKRDGGGAGGRIPAEPVAPPPSRSDRWRLCHNALADKSDA